MNETINTLRQEALNSQQSYSKLESDYTASRELLESRTNDFETKLQSAINTSTQLSQQLESTITQLNQSKIKCIELEDEVTKLTEQNNAFKNQPQEAKNTEIVQNQLHEQLEHINKLEQVISSQKTKLQSFEDNQQLVSVIEEQKESLEKKLEFMEELRTQLVDVEMKLAESQAQQEKWTSFLEKDETFNSPEDVMKDLMVLRTEKKNLEERISRLELELSQSTPTMEQMTQQIDKLDQELSDAKEQIIKESEARMRLQRQRDLAQTETSFLRGQIKSYDSEESVLLQKINNNISAKSTESGLTDGENISNTKENLAFLDNIKNSRITQLEQVLEKYRGEVGLLSKELEKRDGTTPNIESFSPLKRKITPFSSGERVGELTRKIRTLQVELDNTKLALDTRTKELDAAKKQVAKLEKMQRSRENHGSGPKLRILELKDNPAARNEAVKMSTLRALKKENEGLLEQLSQKQTAAGDRKLVPYSSLEAMRQEKIALNTTIADLNKRLDRLKQVFSKQSLEFREAVYALVGYKVDLLPNKKIRATSKFAASEDDCFIFVPEKRPGSIGGSLGSSGKIKFTGIEDGPLTTEYDNLVTFWIKERHDIPCFLAALNLELYDKTTKAASF